MKDVTSSGIVSGVAAAAAACSHIRGAHLGMLLSVSESSVDYVTDIEIYSLLLCVSGAVSVFNWHPNSTVNTTIMCCFIDQKLLLFSGGLGDGGREGEGGKDEGVKGEGSKWNRFCQF